MKAQRRHELHRNELYAELAKVAGFVKRWRTYVVWGLTLAVLVVLVAVYVMRSAESKRQSLQITYDRLTMDPDITPQGFLTGMKTLSTCDDKRIAAMATVQIGNHYYWRFMAAGGVPVSPAARDMADQAAVYYRRAIRDFPEQRATAAQARVGLAKLAESAGDFAAAEAEYKAVTESHELMGLPVVAQARQALDNLESLKAPVRMATTSAVTRPATEPATQPATQPAEDGD